MTLSKVIAYAWIVSILISVAIAVDRGQPILQAFAPIKSFKAFCWQLVAVVLVSLLAILQLYSDLLLLGQQPMTWAMLLIMLYAWACLGAYLNHSE